jgi:hypothetical protein
MMSKPVALALLFGLSAPALAAQDIDSTTMQSPEPRIGEVIYIPVYSHIFQGDKASKQPLSSALVSPIVQAIMSGGTGTQGLSFVTQGKVIEIRR